MSFSYILLAKASRIDKSDIRNIYLNFHQEGAVNILNNNRNYLHVSDFISLLLGITLELLVAIFSVTLT